MKLSSELKTLSTRLGHNFASPKLLIEATTHSSMNTPNRSDNQRLEFLGDRVLGLIIAQEILSRDTDAAEGALAPRFNALVRKETCAAVAQSISLGDALKLGRSEMLSGGRRKQAILGDAMEAVIAAIYLDAGLTKTRRIVLKLWEEHISAGKLDARDAKTMLQEWAQARGMPPPSYEEISRAGPDHAPVFNIQVQLANGLAAKAEATSKREAQQKAAELLLKDCVND